MSATHDFTILGNGCGTLTKSVDTFLQPRVTSDEFRAFDQLNLFIG